MRSRVHAHSGTGPAPAVTAGPERAHHVSLWAVLILAALLLVLSALIHAAAAAPLGGGWPSLGAIWLAALAAIGLAVALTRSRSGTCRWLCLMDGMASVGMLAVGIVNMSGREQTPEALLPPGPVFGVAIASSALVIAGLILASVFFGAWYLMSRHPAGPDQHPSARRP